MNIDKRYCQNRTRKRKRSEAFFPVECDPVSPSEEERQFKLRRFIEDVSKFANDKENCLDKKHVCKQPGPMGVTKPVKKSSTIKPPMKKLLQNGIQTKFFTRGGVLTREMTARLDENLHKIISLNNSEECHCSKNCKYHLQRYPASGSPKAEADSHRPPLMPLLSRTSPRSENWCHTPSPQPLSLGDNHLPTTDPKCLKSIAELDKELYPVFTRIVSSSCAKSKSIHFKNISYVSAVRRKLLDIHLKGKKKNSRALSCPSETQKTTSSVGTSPLPSPMSEPHSSHQNNCAFQSLNFVSTNLKSTKEFLEETIGPSSSGNMSQPSPELRRHRHPQPQLLQRPVIEYHHWSYLPSATKYAHEPFPSHSPPITPSYNLRSKLYDGAGDGFCFSQLNSFLPPVEEESPEFRYYPRRMF